MITIQCSSLTLNLELQRSLRYQKMIYVETLNVDQFPPTATICARQSFMMTTSVALQEVRPELQLNLLASLIMLRHCTPSSVLKDERLSSLPCTVSTTAPEDGLQVAPFEPHLGFQMDFNGTLMCMS